MAKANSDDIPIDKKNINIELEPLVEPPSHFSITRKTIVDLVKKTTERKEMEEVDDINKLGGEHFIVNSLKTNPTTGLTEEKDDFDKREESFGHNRNDLPTVTPFCSLL